MADHKYIRREGTRGNYKYIYEEDLKNTRNYYNEHTNTKAGHKVTSGEVQGPPEVSKEYLEAYRANTKKNDYTPHIVPANNTPKPISNQNHTFTLGADGTTVPVKNQQPQKKESKNPFAGVGKAVSGFGKGIASGLNSAGKGIASTANAAGKGISSAADKATKGMTVAANSARRDIKNVGSKLVMGANGAVEKVKDAADAGLDNAKDIAQKGREAVGDGLIGAVEGAEHVSNAIGKVAGKVKSATLKMIDDNKTVTKSGDEYARLYRDKRIGITNNIESVKGKKKDVRKFDKAYQTDFAAVRATANSDDAWRDMGRKGLEADKLRYDFDTKQQKHIMDDDWEKHDPEVMKKKYPYLAKNPAREYEAIFDTESKYPVSSPKALKKEFDDMMDAAEAYAKAKDHKDRAARHEELATKVRDKAYNDFEKSGARKRLQMRAKAE